MSRSRVCELVLTSFRNVIITLIHRDSASTQRYFACYPQQALTFLRAVFIRAVFITLEPFQHEREVDSHNAGTTREHLEP